MKILSKLKVVLVTAGVVLVLVVLNLPGKNRFKQNAQSAVEAVVSKNFSVTQNEFNDNPNQYLVVDLSESGTAGFENSLNIQFKNLLDDSILIKLKETENKILLVSDDSSIPEKAWVILNQLNYKNVYLLSNKGTREVLNFEFKPVLELKPEPAGE